MIAQALLALWLLGAMAMSFAIIRRWLHTPKVTFTRQRHDDDEVIAVDLWPAVLLVVVILWPVGWLLISREAPPGGADGGR